MIEFTMPAKLNGATLLQELKDSNVVVNGIPKVEEGKLFLDIKKTDEAKAQAVLNAHSGADSEDPKKAILERLGITAEEATLLLS
jgi:hypothetical protein